MKGGERWGMTRSKGQQVGFKPCTAVGLSQHGANALTGRARGRPVFQEIKKDETNLSYFIFLCFYIFTHFRCKKVTYILAES